MQEEDLLESLRLIVKTYAKNKLAMENLNEDMDFIQDLEINSANLVDIILDIEDTFDIEINNEGMEKMINIKSAMEVIRSQISIHDRK